MLQSMERRAFLSASLSLAGGLTALGCVSKPTMKLSHAQIAGIGALGIGMDVFLKVFNDNSFDVQVRNVRVSTVIQNRWQLPPLSYSPNQWLPSDKSVIVRAPVYIPWPMVMPLLAETVAYPTLTYRVRGEADVTATKSLGVEVDKHPVDEKGSIPRAAIVQAALPRFPQAR